MTWDVNGRGFDREARGIGKRAEEAKRDLGPGCSAGATLDYGRREVRGFRSRGDSSDSSEDSPEEDWGGDGGERHGRDVPEHSALIKCIALALLDTDTKARYHAERGAMGMHLDFACYFLGSLGWLAAALRLGPLPYVIGAVLLHLLAAYLSFYRINLYLHYRTHLLLAVKLVNAIVGNYQSPVWQGSPSPDWMTFIVGDLIIYSKIMGQVLVCFILRLPFEYDAVAQALFVGCTLRQNWANCRGLESRTPASRGKYEFLANTLNGGLHLLQAFPHGSAGPAPTIAPACACISVQAFLQLTAGLFLPLCVRYAMEARGRWVEATTQLHQPLEAAVSLWDLPLLLACTLGMSFTVVWPTVTTLACSGADSAAGI